LHLKTKLEQQNKESFICKNNCSIGVLQPKQQSDENQRKKAKKKTGATTWPSKFASSNQGALMLQRLAAKQAKMATARWYRTGSHGSGLTTRHKEQVISIGSTKTQQTRAFNTNSNRNNKYQSKVKP